VADVAPADIAGHMAAAGGTAGKTPQTGIHQQQPMDFWLRPISPCSRADLHR